MFDASYSGMEDAWKRIIGCGARPFGSANVKKCAAYILAEMRSLTPLAKTVEFQADGFDVSDWALSVCGSGQPVKSYLFLGSGASAGFRGRLRYAGLHRVWDMYNWERFRVLGKNQETLAYITVRKDGNAIPQSLAEGNSPLPHFIVGQESEDLLRRAEQQGLEVEGFAHASALPAAKGANIVVPLHGAETRMVLCAHYDTVYNTPGAYDNSAGTAVLMEIARRLRAARFLKGLDIIFMDGEEFNLLGSTYLAGTQSKGVEIVLNIDGVGRGDLLEVWAGPESLERRLHDYLDRLPEIRSSLYINPPPPGSDHAPYYARGIPSCMLTFNDQGTLHSVDDIYDSGKLNNMALMVRLVEGLLGHLGIISV
jgi:hypothetical protein